MNKPIFVVVELTAKEGKFEEMKLLFKELATSTHKEENPVEYFFIEDQNKANTLLSIEKWPNEVEEAQHWKTSHLQSALGKLDEFLSSDPIIHKGFQVI